ncbi:MAG: FeoB-associated Cys-rich membrane protein [Eubacteriales bacterium]|nr:FeoB-associated Cys-rich membrane protein [Eubacteriales bacterium]MDY3332338.1 FeoB-associated Cys-rich membrane protein [Gallibacter sp.]
MGTIIVGIILLAVVASIIVSMVRKKKKGMGITCDCAGCAKAGGCPSCNHEK